MNIINLILYFILLSISKSIISTYNQYKNYMIFYSLVFSSHPLKSSLYFTLTAHLFGLATFQVSHGNMYLIAFILNSRDLEDKRQAYKQITCNLTTEYFLLLQIHGI